MELERRQYTKSYISIAPMIDVVFLLLLFFMLTSNMIQEPAIQIQLPEADSSTLTKRTIISIIVTESREVFLNGRAVEIADLKNELPQLVADRPHAAVNIKTDRGVHVGRLVRVIDEVKLAGVKSFNIVTEKRKKDK